MTREPNGRMYLPGEQPVEEHSFDDLARGLATGTVSRGQALKMVGAAVLSAALMPLFPDTAQALTRRQRRRCSRQGGTVCGEVQRSQVCCAAGRPCCGTARSPVCCPSGRQCVDGSCRCPTGETECSGSCVNLDTDENNCRTCGNACPEGATCVDGSCVCPEGTFECDVVPGELPPRCVECGCGGVECPAGQVCCGGTCCPSGEVCCNAIERICSPPGGFCGA
jgi:hypothetical protein